MMIQSCWHADQKRRPPMNKVREGVGLATPGEGGGAWVILSAVSFPHSISGTHSSYFSHCTIDPDARRSLRSCGTFCRTRTCP